MVITEKEWGLQRNNGDYKERKELTDKGWRFQRKNGDYRERMEMRKKGDEKGWR